MPAWRGWPVYWSAVWVGALTALVIGLILGLTSSAVGAHEAGRLASFHKVGIIALCFAVGGAFAANAVGAWVATKIAGILRAETAMLHGAIVWLVAVPILVGFAALGAGSLFGGWYGGLAGTPVWASSAAGTTDPAVLRNEALAALTAILVGLIGAVLGAWAASGEPMTFTYSKHRNERTVHEREQADVTVREVRTPA
jgi:hypothetical protein